METNELLINAAVWMNLMDMKLSKRCPAQKNSIPFTQNTKTSKIIGARGQSSDNPGGLWGQSNDFEGAGREPYGGLEWSISLFGL